jgi:predicted membrane-bound spermidine synthase
MDVSKFRVEILFFGVTVFAVFFAWTLEIKLDTQTIPTSLNGLTSSISLIIGFTIALIAFVFSTFLENYYDYIRRIYFTIALLVSAASLLWTSYANLMVGSYQTAFRVGMSALALSLVTLFDFLYFFASELRRRQSQT